MLQGDFWSLLCRGRKKKIVTLTIILIFLINAMLYVSLELFNTIRRNREDWSKSWQNEQSDMVKSGMRVIVGHYIGGFGKGNLSDATSQPLQWLHLMDYKPMKEEYHTPHIAALSKKKFGRVCCEKDKDVWKKIINSNNYAPVNGAGEGGRPVQLSQRELITARELYQLHSYNILVGDKISINRSLPDMRSDSCKSVEFNLDNLPTATVIIVFHNEAWSTLMRTVMSVIMRSPKQLLKQIILVDDASERKYLGKELDDAIADLDKVEILRMTERKGLVAARLLGARKADGDVLVFLDAHCEVTQGWLEPLLDRAGSDDVFICPHIDLLSEDTLAYTKSIDAHWGAFNWNLLFRWLNPSAEVMAQKAENPSKPYPTPAMAGGLFAVRKSLFWRLGGYDEGMLIWGAENLELSWRAWQCGARVEITPCSRVGHIFRRDSPYKYPGGVRKVLNINSARAATVWMDEWADFFFKFNPNIAAIRDQQAVYSRVELRKNLKCKSFKWYLENVWPQHFFPTDERWFGKIKSDLGPCLAVPEQSTGLAVPARGVSCGVDNSVLNTMVVYTPEGKIMGDDNMCLERSEGQAKWKACKDSPKQIWEQKGPRLKTKDGLCLTLSPSDKDDSSDVISTKRCSDKMRDPATTQQIWHFERVPWR